MSTARSTASFRIACAAVITAATLGAGRRGLLQVSL
jgi:hypothetical protein